MRNYLSGDSDDSVDDNEYGHGHKQSSGKYAIRRDIARNGKSQKGGKKNFKPHNPNHHSDTKTPDSY